MEITKQNEISAALAEAVLKAEPGTPEFERAVKANDDWLRTLNEVDKSESEIRIRQNAADDQLIAKRDDDEMKLKQMTEKMFVDIAGLAVQAAGMVAMIWVSVKATNAELGEQPFFGLAKQISNQSFRFLIKK